MCIRDRADRVGGYGGDYAELKADWIGKNGFVRYWDEVAKVPYLFDEMCIRDRF